MVSDRQDGAATAAPSDKKTGENYFDESGEYLSDADSRELDPADSATFHQNLARLRELMRESDTPAAHADRPRGAPS
ncbi:hypothetical protein [Burkholderia glumae]|uniref:hypothetical protein n=1 Tax=Burkholderia glumae TaxID=337 RepID=UPI0021519183|nr:hypothetical protein [Burkholderia glumae]